MDALRPKAEAIAILNGQISAIGKSAEIRSLAGRGTTVLGLRGKTIVPGFIDCHNHLIEFGLALRNLDLTRVRSIKDLRVRIRNAADKCDSWILGRGWDQEKFSEHRYPTRYDIDDVSNSKPLLLRRICGHICLANSEALRISGITASTPNPRGGKIDKDSDGIPTGILRESAVDLVEEKIPAPSLTSYKNAVLTACQHALEEGLTTVHCITSSRLELRALIELKREDKLSIRLIIYIPIHKLQSATELGLTSGFGDEWLRLGGVKIYTDGSLGARTAALVAPYQDEESSRGILAYASDQLRKLVDEADAGGFQIAAHAIGDAANRMVVEAFEKLNNPKKLRHRIEHASVLNPQLIRKIAKLGLVASVQPHFITSDTWIEDRLGHDRAAYAYPFKSLLHAGIMVVGGSDCPIETLSPLQGIDSAVNRKLKTEAVDVAEALAFYTKNAAYASFEDEKKGTVSVGKLADLVVLSGNPLNSSYKIQGIRVLLTIVDGKIMYRRKTGQ